MGGKEENLCTAARWGPFFKSGDVATGMHPHANTVYGKVMRRKQSNIHPENTLEAQIARRAGVVSGEVGRATRKGPGEGRRGRAEAAGALGSAVRSAGETQFTLPCRHPG